MNWLDAVLLAAAGLRALVRQRHGFWRAGLELGGVALGLGLAVRYGSALAAGLEAVGGVPTWLGRPASFVALVLPPAVAGHWAGRWTAAARGAGWAGWDRLAAALLGVAEVALVALVGLVAWAELGGSLYAPALLDSRLAGWLLQVAPAFYRWLSGVLAA